MANDWPSLKAKQLRRVLQRLGYQPKPRRGHGSHVILEAEGRPDIVMGTTKEFTGGLVRDILTKQVGLTQEEAREVLG